MSRIGEIIASGRAPGVRGFARDPQSADVAVPRAFRELERTNSASKICRDAGYTAETIKKTWDFKQPL